MFHVVTHDMYMDSMLFTPPPPFSQRGTHRRLCESFVNVYHTASVLKLFFIFWKIQLSKIVEAFRDDSGENVRTPKVEWFRFWCDVRKSEIESIFDFGKSTQMDNQFCEWLCDPLNRLLVFSNSNEMLN